jgi:holo-[acyl-carrier protein] synthase
VIVGVGIDIVDLQRFTARLARAPRLADKLFVDAERNLPPRSLAARFAGKEAVFKTLGTGLIGFSWHDVEIFSNELGEPIVELSPRAQAVAAARGGAVVRLSLTHTREMAGAMAILCSPAGG